jgi:thiamine pyrophosphate-dependent acetolactate synthase large subunit-like protein
MRGDGRLEYGSDIAIAGLSALGIDHIALNPGASFRGLHESMVHAGAQRAVLCLSEGVAVAAAHGYAKAAGRPMAVFLHNLVGLQSGSMALFNAWVDQVPMLVIGGSGPADSARRRPWIDWIHSAHPQGGLVRDFVKWDDEPASVGALVEALAYGHRVATTAPKGPVYLALDALLQESPAAPVDLSALTGESGPGFTAPGADLEELAEALVGAQAPVLLADHVGRSADGYRALIELAELTGAHVVDLGGRHNFPNTHPLDGTSRRRELLAGADLVLALEVRDLAWALCDTDPATRTSRVLVAPGTDVRSIGLTDLMQSGFLRREGAVAHLHTSLLADTAVALPQLVELVRAAVPGGRREPSAPDGPRATVQPRNHTGEITDDVLAAAAFDAVRTGPWQLAHGLLHGGVRRHWQLDRFNCHLGGSGGAGLGYGVGATVGAALAADDSDTLVVALQPDGDLLYTPSALWTAAHEKLAMVVVVANNRTYGQDRMHQTLMSQTRGRPAEHIPVGIDIEDPDIDFAGLASSQGVEAFGPVDDAATLPDVLQRACRIARDEHRPVLVDVVVAR